MSNHSMTRVNTKIKRVFKATASVLLIMSMMFTVVFGFTGTAHAADQFETELWAVVIGDEEVLYVDSEESANQVIEGLSNYYLSKGSNVLEVQFDPIIEIKKITAYIDEEFSAFSSNARTIDVEEAIAKLSEGKVEYYVYKTEEGDTLKSIAKEKGISAKKLASLNFGEYDTDETIKEGTYMVLYSEVPYVEVTTVEEIISTKSIDYNTVYKKTSSLTKGTQKVKTKGVKGKQAVTEKITKVNGEDTNSELISKQTIKKPVDKVVLKGTGSVTAKAGKTFDFVEGSEVVEYAKQFVGNPYRYGGTSLTNGADCSGFVYAVYKHFGIDLPRTGQSGVGKAVSYKNAKKGDILIYSGHVAIYAGNGKAVHAVNERLGIRVTSATYTGPIIGVRRILD